MTTRFPQNHEKDTFDVLRFLKQFPKSIPPTVFRKSNQTGTKFIEIVLYLNALVPPFS